MPPSGKLVKKLARELVSATVNQLRRVAASHELFSGSILSNARVWALLKRIDAVEAEGSYALMTKKESYRAPAAA